MLTIGSRADHKPGRLHRLGARACANLEVQSSRRASARAAPMTAPSHVPVMLSEVLCALRPLTDGCYVDCTFGRGGHARGLLNELGERGRVLAMDRDPGAIDAARILAETDSRLTVAQARFSRLAATVESHSFPDRVDGVLFDLGVSSAQLADPARGFSFRNDGPLDMRMDPASGPSAGDWLNTATEREIADVLWALAEERHAKRIARRIVDARARAPLTRTGELAEIVKRALPPGKRSRRAPDRSASPPRHPATRTFQAIRIFVNHELEELGVGLEQACKLLAPGARMAVISFHSLEDRIVKRFIRTQQRGPRMPRRLPVDAPAPTLTAVGRAKRPSKAEIDGNPRARSAVLRVAERSR